jgi:oligosaccharide repeat unit polymerase
MLITSLCATWIAVTLIIFFFNQPVIPYLTYFGISIIYLHFLVVIGGHLFYKWFINKRIKSYYMVTATLSLSYYIVLILSSIGVIWSLTRVNLIDALIKNELMEMRAKGFDEEITIPKQIVILSNFIYPLAVIGTCFSLFTKRYFLLILTFLLFITYSLANGGKGNLLILSILSLGTSLYLYKWKLIKLDSKVIKIVIAFVIVIFSFISYINYTRIGNTGEVSISDVLIVYTSDSVPAFCQLLKETKLELIKFDLSDHDLMKELSALFGGNKIKRAIDQNNVYIPEGFNVFTSFADSILAFGLIGSLFYYFIIGIMFSYAESKTVKLSRLFLFSVLFLFVIYSLFVDVFFFMMGSWYCLMFYFLIDIGNKTATLSPEFR